MNWTNSNITKCIGNLIRRSLLIIIISLSFSYVVVKGQHYDAKGSDSKALNLPEFTGIYLFPPVSPPYFIYENEHAIMKFNYDEFINTLDSLSPFSDKDHIIDLLMELDKNSSGIHIHGPCFKPVLRSFPDNACLTYDYAELLPVLLEHKFICSINSIEIDSVLINGKHVEKDDQLRLWYEIKYTAANILQAGKAIVIDKSNNVEMNKIIYGQIQESSKQTGNYGFPDGRTFLEVLEKTIQTLDLDMDL